MGKIDERREIIGFLKILFAIILATSIAIIGWIAQHYNIADIKLIITSFLALMFLQIGFILLIKKIRKELKQVRKL